MKPPHLRYRRKPLSLILSVTILATGAPVYGETDPALANCLAGPSAGRSAGMNACMVRAAEDWSKRMNTAYQRLRTTLDPTSRRLLEASQEAWETYRRKELTFVHGPWRQRDGTFEQLNIAGLRLDELRDRARTLESYLPSK